MVFYRSAVLCALTVLSSLTSSATAFDYQFSGDDSNIQLVDIKSGISDLKTLFTEEDVEVTISDVSWSLWNITKRGDTDSLIGTYETFVNGKVKATGVFNLTSVGKLIPTSFEVGTVRSSESGAVIISVALTLDGVTINAEDTYQTFGAGTSLLPLFVVLSLAIFTNNVELSLGFCVFFGACMVTGDIELGIKKFLDGYIMDSVSDSGHQYVMLFSMFLSGLVSMMEKSGGLFGFTKDISKLATTSRSGQAVSFTIGCFIFFDDYTNILLAGETMRPLMDMLSVSREKLSFIVDATAAPIASMTPISSWVGFETGLIQDELDKIIEKYEENGAVFPLKRTGIAVFLESIKYRYYPIFMLVLIPLLIATQRDAGPMLVAERKTKIYNRTDGGDNAGMRKKEALPDGAFVVKENQPSEDTPWRSWNMIVPVFLLTFFIIYFLEETGTSDTEERDFFEKLNNSDSYSALLWGTFITALCTMLLYLLQFKQNGELLIPTPAVLLDALKGSYAKIRAKPEDAIVPYPKPLMSIFEGLESFFFGFTRVFPALIVLVLAWASGAVMGDVGADRMFSSWIVDSGLSYKWLPTLSFVISFFMALATGTSWGTMTIVFPLMLGATFDASNGDPVIFYSTVAGVLSGSVAGDHVSPISDTTVLSAMACDCNLISHVQTQSPYVFTMIFLSIVFGTIPVGFDMMPNVINILLGVCVLVVYVIFFCQPVISPTGKFDFITELFMKIAGDESPLIKLKADTIKRFEEGPTASLTADADEKNDV